MENIDYIEIIIFNLFEINKIGINVKKLKIVKNDEVKQISNKSLTKLFEIIKYWDTDYYGSLLDSEKFTINLIADGKYIKTYQGAGMYPNNYHEFKSWIGSI